MLEVGKRISADVLAAALCRHHRTASRPRRNWARIPGDLIKASFTSSFVADATVNEAQAQNDWWYGILT